MEEVCYCDVNYVITFNELLILTMIFITKCGPLVHKPTSNKGKSTN